MDVRQYYRKLREVEAGITEVYVRVTSLETSDGGRPGVVSEVSREQAAKLIVEGRVMLSTETEQKVFFDKQGVERKALEKTDLARRLQVTIVSAPDKEELEASTWPSAEQGVKK